MMSLCKMKLLKLISARSSLTSGISICKINNTLNNKTFQPDFKYLILNKQNTNLFRLKSLNLESILYFKNEFLASDSIDIAYKQLLESCLNDNIEPTQIIISDSTESKYAYIFKKDLYIN